MINGGADPKRRPPADLRKLKDMTLNYIGALYTQCEGTPLGRPLTTEP